MKSKTTFLNLQFTVFHLSSCSTIAIKPKEPIEALTTKQIMIKLKIEKAKIEDYIGLA
jgi:hypothetical protein